VRALTSLGESSGSFLNGLRVLELADELGEYCGKVLAGLGADVIKIEPPGGENTRCYGPFYHDDPHPNRSLYFWHYNFGKRSAVLDFDLSSDRETFLSLVETADVVIDTRHREFLNGYSIGESTLRRQNTGLVYARISPFGDAGPWADFQASDLIHLALGGVVMNCGYDPDPLGNYDTPPVAPQMWQSYHIAGELMAMQIIAALNHRFQTGRGQSLAGSVHQAVSASTESDAPDWVYSRQDHRRLTCRHSFPRVDTSLEALSAASTTTPGIAATKDGRWVLPYRTYLAGFGSLDQVITVLRQHGMQDDLDEPRYSDPEYASRPNVVRHIDAVVGRFVNQYLYDRDVWKDGQAAGLAWAPLRTPEENVREQHWSERETFARVEYPELGETFTQIGAKWLSPGLPWRTGPRAPLVGEHSEDVLVAQQGAYVAARTAVPVEATPAAREAAGSRPFALEGVRVVDLGWLLASGGAGRFFAAHGAQVIKVEHESKFDLMRYGPGIPPVGGRAERDAATAALQGTHSESPNRSGHFMEINAGKLSLSLNLKTPEGREVLKALIAEADIVAEGFSPGTMDRMGLGYESLKSINPRIVYVQQSGMGQLGTYGRMKSFGPTAQAFSGLSEMSGLESPFPPAGIGYSYLDWFGAYQMATAMMAGLFRVRATGEGCWIDSSQVETGLFLTGTAVLDHEVNGRRWSRLGNNPPYKPAAPQGVYPTRGVDRWIAITVFSDAQWMALTRVLSATELARDPRFLSQALRIRHSDELDYAMRGLTADWDAHSLMEKLQAQGVPAGVCATAQDRYEADPQLDHLNWTVELPQSEIGTWPVKEIPVTFSETPPFIGGLKNRHGPNYGEDTADILRDVLGLKAEKIAQLVRDHIV
jgi:crotonobetainyl-CoA:carnitine CoA-transferase CaiB-like acyl-CoA transferase